MSDTFSSGHDAGHSKRFSEDDIVSALAEPGRASADVVRANVRRALYEMVTDGTVELTREKMFRACRIVSKN